MNNKHYDNDDIDRKINQVIRQITKLSDKQTMHIQNLTRIGVALSSVTNLEKIFDMILVEAIAYTNADAATIYKVSADKQYLDFVLVYNKTLGIKMGRDYGPITWPSIPLYDKKGKPRLEYIVTNVFHTKQLLCFDDVYLAKKYDISRTKQMDKENNYRSKSMLTLPLKSHENEVLGVLKVINATDKQNKVTHFQEDHVLMLNSLASQASITMSNRKLINDLEELLMQFMKVIAKAIERKSKYSSNHITKVAMLADMIARKINEDTSTRFHNMKFSAAELKELSMAGLMHDVGKIVTPEHIMDKATKLEHIVDRIALVDLRYKLFKKALTLYKLQYGEPKLIKTVRNWYPYKTSTTINELFKFLDEDKLFLDSVNDGGEYVSDASLARIDRIQKMDFQMDDEKWSLLTEDEVENLKIRRGTLTAEEKRIVDEHVLVTWEMLSELSFPTKYKNVALYAASHHEKLNGTGHPFGYKADQLPPQSRILAIADIFEAVTSSDRPYKKPNNLSESLEILANCAKNGEIDRDILDFIIDSGLYVEFAELFMSSKQIDRVDTNAIKKIYHPELKDK
ncbi:MAG: HD domain-containing phosphohydrolase [Candidatus Cloacimonadaceae bacterium]